MSSIKKHTLLLLLLLAFSPVKAYDLDSLKRLLRTNLSDTSRCYVLKLISDHEPSDNWMDYNLEMMRIATHALNKKDIAPPEAVKFRMILAIGNQNTAFYYQNTGDFDKALKHLNAAANYSKENDDMASVAQVYCGMGTIYQLKKNYSKAEEYYNKSLQGHEKIGSPVGMCMSLSQLAILSYNLGDLPEALKRNTKLSYLAEKYQLKDWQSQALYNIALILADQNEREKAVENVNKALKLREETGNKLGMSYCLHFLGVEYKDKGEFEKALDFHTRSLKLREELSDARSVMMSYQGIGATYMAMGKLNEAKNYFSRQLDLSKKLSDSEWEGSGLISLGRLALKLNNKNEAIRYFNEALSLGNKEARMDVCKSATEELFKIYQQIGDHKKALEFHILFTQFKDSMINSDTKNALMRTKFQLEFQKKELDMKKIQDAKDYEHMKKKAKQDTDIYRQRLFSISASVAVLLILLLAFFIYRNLRQSKAANKIISEQKAEVEKQKALVEHKQKEVMDSIHYAQRIQKAQMPSQNFIERSLNKLNSP